MIEKILAVSLLAGTPVVNCYAQNVLTKQEYQQLESTFQKDINEMQRNIEIITETAKNYAKTKPLLEDNMYAYLFNNSIDRTLEGLNKFKVAYQKTGLIIPTGILLDSKAFMDNGGGIKGDFSEEYFIAFKQAVEGFGYSITGSDDINFINPIAKEFFIDEDDMPLDLHLITEGNHRGFFVNELGDLVVPGLSFYKGIADGSLNLSFFECTDFYWQDKFLEADEFLKDGKYDEAIRAIDEIIEQDLIPKSGLACLYINKGRISIKNEGMAAAKENFAKAIECGETKWLSTAHSQRGLIKILEKEHQSALEDFHIALKHENSETERFRIANYIIFCESELEKENKKLK